MFIMDTLRVWKTLYRHKGVSGYSTLVITFAVTVSVKLFSLRGDYVMFSKCFMLTPG
jgi:hypothetical protein